MDLTRFCFKNCFALVFTVEARYQKIYLIHVKFVQLAFAPSLEYAVTCLVSLVIFWLREFSDNVHKPA